MKISRAPFVVSIIVSFFSATASAGGPIDNLQVVEILAAGYTDGTDRPITRIRLASAHDNPDNCNNATYIVIRGSLAGEADTVQTTYYEQQFTVALAALAGGKTLSAWVSGCTSDNKFPLATRLSILQ